MYNSETLFTVAAQEWLEAHRAYIAPRTICDYEQYIGSLNRFFGTTRLGEIDINAIRAYHKGRLLPSDVSRMEGRAHAKGFDSCHEHFAIPRPVLSCNK